MNWTKTEAGRYSALTVDNAHRFVAIKDGTGWALRTYSTKVVAGMTLTDEHLRTRWFDTLAEAKAHAVEVYA